VSSRNCGKFAGSQLTLACSTPRMATTVAAHPIAQVDVLPHTVDSYGGVIVCSESLPCDTGVFKDSLQHSVAVQSRLHYQRLYE
jgi:hypothetical protein